MCPDHSKNDEDENIDEQDAANRRQWRKKSCDYELKKSKALNSTNSKHIQVFKYN